MFHTMSDDESRTDTVGTQIQRHFSRTAYPSSPGNRDLVDIRVQTNKQSGEEREEEKARR